MSLEIQMQKLALELRNLSSYQLETFKELTETAAMDVNEAKYYWMEMVEQFKKSWDGLDNLAKMEEVQNKPCWIKLTDYMYVEGVMGGKKKFLVDIGANYFVYMTIKNAKEFFERRGVQGMEMMNYYEDLFYKRMLVYSALNLALKAKFESKLDKLEKMREIEDKQSSVVKSESGT